MRNTKRGYPFTAIIGQEDMKLALILNCVNPLLGGVLIRGEKGTAKSTAVRALAELLPHRTQVIGCAYGCDPQDEAAMCDECRARLECDGSLPFSEGAMRVIDLPVSATEDRVVGTLDIEEAIRKGEKRFEPGILAAANRNMLYVDEVNLLDDHVVDVLLDSAAMGVNTIEREGISYSHPARFVLVGTMNPEEGDLRPQLLDRFGLVVDVFGERDIERRVEVIRNRLAYEENPDRMAEAHNPGQQAARARIAAAISLLPVVRPSDALFDCAARISIALDVDGHRADIGMIKTAMTIAAYEGRKDVLPADMLSAARFVLPHRMRRQPFEEGVMDGTIVERIVAQLDIP